MAPLGLYVHVPFCQALCTYCNFTRGLVDEAVQRRYVAALTTDIRHHAADLPVDTIYLGGGTPSVLTPEQIAAILEACRSSFRVSGDAEITMEANPESATDVALDGFRRAGVNRLSVGVQSFREEDLRRLGRVHSVERAAAVVPTARRAGFDNVSLDLMLWLPGQTVADALASVERLVAIEPEHASLYLLEIYPNAPLRDDMARHGWSVAPDDDAADMYERAMETLEDAGYAQYEISNVCRPQRSSRHNLKYWQDGEWLAFGCGAHGAWNGQRWRVVASTTDYIERVDAGASTTAETWPRDAERRLEEALFMGLRLAQGLDTQYFQEVYGVDLWARFGEALAPFERAGLVARQAGRWISLTRRGMLMANEVMAVFIGHRNAVE